MRLHRWFLVFHSFDLLFKLLLNDLNLCGVSNEKFDHLLKVKLAIAVFVNLLEFLLELSLHLLGDGTTLGAVSEVLLEGESTVAILISGIKHNGRENPREGFHRCNVPLNDLEVGPAKFLKMSIISNLCIDFGHSIPALCDGTHALNVSKGSCQPVFLLDVINSCEDFFGFLDSLAVDILGELVLVHLKVCLDVVVLNLIKQGLNDWNHIVPALDHGLVVNFKSAVEVAHI